MLKIEKINISIENNTNPLADRRLHVGCNTT